MLCCMSDMYHHFNPRSHEGSDAQHSTQDCNLTDFNPRSHEGSDDLFLQFETKFNISIHAPTKGATLALAHTQTYILYFNPRSHEGSDSVHQADLYKTEISIHAPTKGATTCKRVKFRA